MSSPTPGIEDQVISPPAASPRRRRFSVDDLFADGRARAVGVVDLADAKEIQLDRIEADPHQPRRTFDEGRLAELAASIAIEGVLQPIVVRYHADADMYIIVHGERRFRASKLAGRSSIPAIVREVPQERRLVQQLMENVVRDDLNAIDRAIALRSLKQQLGDAPWEQVAEAVGIRRSRLFQLLGAEKLPESIREDIRAGRLSEKQSRALQGLSPGCIEALRDAIVTDDLSSDEAMRLARGLRGRKIENDADAAAETIRELRAPAPPSEDANELGALLSAISAAASGGVGQRASLKRLADGMKLASFDNERLQSNALALTRTLARAPMAELRPGMPVFATLTALHGALDAILGGEA